jgi:putative NIF3 family GTP cyclohydrolase 1 type 2
LVHRRRAGLYRSGHSAGVDLYLSGEASEQTFHSARENDISFIAAGHHATERYGVQALGDYLARGLPWSTCSSIARTPSDKTQSVGASLLAMRRYAA